MTITRAATTAGLQSLALLSVWAINQVALAQEFRSLLSPNLSTAPNTYQGSPITGNTITNVSRYQNISGVAFGITGVAGIQSFDPEDLGFPDLTPENSPAARSALAALFPTYDMFVATSWVTTDPPRRTWQTHVSFDSQFPIVISPGEEFELVRVSRNDLLGPNFGPTTAPLPLSQVNVIGEVVIAFDFDWHYVPEPASAWLLFGCLLGLPRRADSRSSAR